MSYPPLWFVLLPFLILPSLIHQLTSYELLFLNTFLLIIPALQFILMSLNLNMALVLPLCSPPNTSSSNYQECPMSLWLSYMLFSLPWENFFPTHLHSLWFSQTHNSLSLFSLWNPRVAISPLMPKPCWYYRQWTCWPTDPFCCNERNFIDPSGANKCSFI